MQLLPPKYTPPQAGRLTHPHAAVSHAPRSPQAVRPAAASKPAEQPRPAAAACRPAELAAGMPAEQLAPATALSRL